MADIYQIPEGNGGSTDASTLLTASLLSGNNNGGFLGGGNGLGGGILGFLLGMLFPRLFGNGGLFGGGMYGNGLVGSGSGAGTAYLGNMISNDNGRDLLMQAINNSGERSTTAIAQLSASLGQDFNLVNGAIQTINTSLNQIANTQGMNALQVINAIQSGNCTLGHQLQQCCCQNQMAIMEQTNALQNGMAQGFNASQLGMLNGFNGVQQGLSGVNQAIAAKSAADQLSTCQQTYSLTDTMNRNYLALDNKIDAMESNRKDREITALTAKVAQLESQNFTTGVIAQAMAPVNAQLASIRSEVDDVKCKLPQTVTLPYSGLSVVPTWQAQVAYDVAGSAIANRFFPSQADAAAATPTPAA